MTETTNEFPVTDKVSETSDLTAAVTEVLETQPTTPIKKQRIILHPDNLITIDKREYRLAANYREGFDIEQINERYSDVLNRYDYIVGDIGFEQLRLKGFFSDEQKKMPLDTRISSLQDYLYEYCNFGCAYFVLERLGPIEIQTQDPRNNQTRNRRNNNNNRKNRSQPGNQSKQNAHIKEKQSPNPRNKNQAGPKKKPFIKNRRDDEPKGNPKRETKPVTASNQEASKRNFTIRQTDATSKGE